MTLESTLDNIVLGVSTGVLLLLCIPFVTRWLKYRYLHVDRITMDLHRSWLVPILSGLIFLTPSILLLVADYLNPNSTKNDDEENRRGIGRLIALLIYIMLPLLGARSRPLAALPLDIWDFVIVNIIFWPVFLQDIQNWSLYEFLYREAVSIEHVWVQFHSLPIAVAAITIFTFVVLRPLPDTGLGSEFHFPTLWNIIILVLCLGLSLVCCVPLIISLDISAQLSNEHWWWVLLNIVSIACFVALPVEFFFRSVVQNLFHAYCEARNDIFAFTHSEEPHDHDLNDDLLPDFSLPPSLTKSSSSLSSSSSSASLKHRSNHHHHHHGREQDIYHLPGIISHISILQHFRHHAHTQQHTPLIQLGSSYEPQDTTKTTSTTSHIPIASQIQTKQPTNNNSNAMSDYTVSSSLDASANIHSDESHSSNDSYTDNNTLLRSFDRTTNSSTMDQQQQQQQQAQQQPHIDTMLPVEHYQSFQHTAASNTTAPSTTSATLRPSGAAVNSTPLFPNTSNKTTPQVDFIVPSNVAAAAAAASATAGQNGSDMTTYHGNNNSSTLQKLIPTFWTSSNQHSSMKEGLLTPDERKFAGLEAHDDNDHGDDDSGLHHRPDLTQASSSSGSDQRLFTTSTTTTTTQPQTNRTQTIAAAPTNNSNMLPTKSASSATKPSKTVLFSTYPSFHETTPKYDEQIHSNTNEITLAWDDLDSRDDSAAGLFAGDSDILELAAASRRDHQSILIKSPTPSITAEEAAAVQQFTAITSPNFSTAACDPVVFELQHQASRARERFTVTLVYPRLRIPRLPDDGDDDDVDGDDDQQDEYDEPHETAASQKDDDYLFSSPTSPATTRSARPIPNSSTTPHLSDNQIVEIVNKDPFFSEELTCVPIFPLSVQVDGPRVIDATARELGPGHVSSAAGNAYFSRLLRFVTPGMSHAVTSLVSLVMHGTTGTAVSGAVQTTPPWPTWHERESSFFHRGICFNLLMPNFYDYICVVVAALLYACAMLYHTSTWVTDSHLRKLHTSHELGVIWVILAIQGFFAGYVWRLTNQLWATVCYTTAWCSICLYIIVIR